jgi:hypothetical protein
MEGIPHIALIEKKNLQRQDVLDTVFPMRLHPKSPARVAELADARDLKSLGT